MTIQGIKELTCVVGIGASAGGLEALERFFRAVRPHANVAYVVVQHLSPEFKSMMGEILGRLTDLDIQPIADQMELKPDTIYLNVPRTKLTVQNGRFQQTAISDGDGENIFKPIDTFFESLAQAYSKNAVGVILSGTGSDGRQGVRHIAQAGGLVLTQDLNSALFGAMPQAAREMIPYSLELSPEEMPELIQDYIRDPESINPIFLNMAEVDLLTEETALSFMLSLLQRKFQTDFTRYKPQTIIRRLERRMALDSATSLVDYARKAQQDDELLDQIYRELLIDVTRFFRDPEAFTWLETHIIPQLVNDKPDKSQLRIWIAACSSGEEAYSLAMLFLEEIERQDKQLDLRIFATDIHQSSIDIASKGLFSVDALDQIPYTLSKKYFETYANHIKVTKKLRQTIVFSMHDLLSTPYFGNQDLITCRNMLIYIRPQSQEDILHRFTAALNVNGYLFLGPSEHLSNQIARNFETLSRHWRVFQKVSESYVTPAAIATNANIHLPKYLQSQPTQSPTMVYQGWEPALLKALIPAGFVCNDLGELKEIYGKGKNYLNFSIGKVNLNLTELLSDSLAIGLRNGLAQAQRKKSEVEISNIQVNGEDGIEIINLRVIPFEQETGSQEQEKQEIFYLVVLDEVRNLGQMAPLDPAEISPHEFNELHSLKLELAFTRESLQATLEEVETSNEELQSSNEELTAANEELQSTNEELSSVNEELYTVNAEYQDQNRRLNQLFNDKHNLERASGVLTIFLDEDLAIREMTPACYQIFDLIDADIGRPISQFTTVIGLNEATLQHLVSTALDGQQTAVETVSSKQVPMLLTVIPYQGDHNRLNGVILNFVDLTLIRQLETENREMHSIADSVPVLMTHIGKDLRYRYVNDHFLTLTGKRREEVIGQHPKDVIGEAHAQLLKPYHDRALQGKHVEFINDSFMRDKGRYAKNNFFPNWIDGEVEGFYCFAIEVTEFEIARQKSLNELRVSEARYKSIIETQPQLICRWRPDDFTIVFSNQNCVDYYEKDHVQPGSILTDGFSSEYTEIFKEKLAILLESGEPQTMEETRVGSDGKKRVTIWTDTPIYDAEGKIVEIQGIGRDVTAEREAQQALEISEAKYRSVLETQSEMILRFRPDDYTLTYFNPAYDKFFGAGKYDFYLGQNLLTNMDPDGTEAFKGHVAKLVETREPQVIEEVHAWKDGEKRITVWTDTPIVDGDGNVVEIQGVGRDVTAERQAQKELEIAYGQISDLFNNLPAWVSIINREYQFEFLNDYYQTNLGVDPNESIGKPIWELSGPDLFEKEKPYYDRALNGETVQYYSSIEENEFEFHADLRLIPRKRGDEVVGFYLMGSNITEIKMSQKELSSALGRLEAINDGLPVWISIIDKDHVFRYMNSFYHETLGIDIEASLGEPVKQVLGETIYSIGKPYYDQALKGETVTYLNYTGQNRKEKVGLVTLVPENANAESDYFYVIAIDISDQIDAQNKLEDALAQLTMVNDRLPIWISIVDKNYHYTYVNDFYMKSLGRKKEEFVGKHIQDALGKKFFKMGKPNYDRALAGERVDYLNKGTFDGEEVDIAVSLVPRKNDDGEVTGFFVLAVQNLFLQPDSQKTDDDDDGFVAGLVEPKGNPRKNV